MTEKDDKRTADEVKQSRFRSNRLFQDGSSWFFYTREGTIEGPFPSRVDAMLQLDMFIKSKESTLKIPKSDLTLKPL